MENLKVFINTYKGVDYVLKVIERIAKTRGCWDVYREMMDYIVGIHNVRPWGDIQKYAQKIGCYIYHGDKPKRGTIKIASIYAKGERMEIILKNLYGETVSLDKNREYLLVGNQLIPL